MIDTDLETRLLNVMALSRKLVPAEQLHDMTQLVQAGEPGVALENLCTQLYEYDAALEPDTLKQIETLGKAMGLAPKYWQRLGRK